MRAAATAEDEFADVRPETLTGGQTRVVREPIRDYSELVAIAAVEHEAWRERRTADLAQHAPPGSDPSQSLDALSAQLLTLTVALAERYGTPDLGNKIDPVDELVYIILSRRTREGAYQSAYETLKSRYRTWEELALAPSEEIEATIRSSGLGQRKARSLKQALRALIDTFGSCTFEPTRTWDDEKTFDFLCSLPEVGPKSAACVMMCSLDRPAFPVDAHVGRVLERLGLFQRYGLKLEGADHKAKQRLLLDAIPPALRYSLHVNLLMHGRLVCVPLKPRCASCVVADSCASRRS